METILNHDNHLSSETLEEYVRGRLTVSQVALVNDHLFECDHCHAQYEQEAQLLISLRNAAPGPQEDVAAVLPFWSRITAFRGPLLAGASAAVLALVLVPQLSEVTSPASAELTAYRNDVAATAPANRPLVLHLDTNGLGELQQVRAEVADSSGTQVWNGNANLQGGRWQLSIEKRFSAGRYWVRIYAGESTDLLREFSLQLK